MRRFTALVIIFAILLNMVAPSSGFIVLAAEEGGLQIKHTIWDGTNFVESAITATAGDVIKTRIEYGVSGSQGLFFDTKIVYPLPEGTTYKSSTSPSHIVNKTYDEGTHTLTFELASPDSGNELNAGSVSEFEVEFKFNEPSSYPNGATVYVDGVVGSFHRNSDLSDIETTLSVEDMTINYNLADSWNIDLTGSVSEEVVNDPNVDAIDIAYKARLSGGNINLKDVKVRDTLTDDATIISSNRPYVMDGNDVVFTIDDAASGSNVDVDYTVRYLIDRDGDVDDEGVIGGRSRTRNVSVSATDITTVDSGEIASGTLHSFITDTDTLTTDFSVSTATWALTLSPNANVQLALNPSVTTVDEVYKISLSGGDVPLVNTTIVMTVPDGSTPLEGYYAGGSFDSDARTITWTDLSLAVETHDWYVTLRYDIDRDGDGSDDGAADGRSRPVSVSVTGYPIAKDDGPQGVPLTFNPGSAAVTTSFSDMNISWRTQQSATTSTYTLPNIIADEPSNEITYTITLDSTSSTVTDNLPLETVVVTSDYPPYATYVADSYTVSDDVTVDSFTNDGDKLTWELKNITAGVEPKITFRMTYNLDADNSGDGVKINTKQVNTASIEAKTTDGVDITLSTVSASQTVTFAENRAPAPSMSININGYDKNASFNSGAFNINNTGTYAGSTFYEDTDQVVYDILLNNTNGYGTALKANETMFELNGITDDVILNSIDFGSWDAAVTFDMTYDTNKNTNVDAGSYNDGSGSYEFNLAEGDYVTDLKIVFTSAVPSGFAFTTPIKLTTTVDANIDLKHITQNATFKKKYTGFGNVEKTLSDSTDSVSYTNSDNTPIVESLTLTDDSNTSPYSPSETINFKVNMNTSSYSTSGLKNIAIVAILPEALDRDTFNWTNDGSWGDDNKDIEKPSLTVEALGTNTLVLWQFTEGYELPEGDDLVFKYSVKPFYHAAVTSHASSVYLMATDDFEVLSSFNKTDDTENYDKDANTLKRADGSSEQFSIEASPSVDNTMLIKAELDADFSNYPSVGQTTPGGSADYKFVIHNNGNVAFKSIEVVDVFPYVNDAFVLAPGAPRNSKWAPYLLEAISQGQQAIVLDKNDVPSNANLKVEYSLSKDPIRPVSDGLSTVGSENPSWTTTAPDDLTTVKSIRLTLDGFQTTDATPVARNFEGGDTATITFKMRAPVGAPYAPDPDAPVDSIDAAWNSVGITAQKMDDLYVLWTEPKKVGVIVVGNPAGEIGNFVWFDENNDGIQNDGYDDENAGINGVEVILMRSDDVEIDRTLTSNNSEGKPGYYLFPNLGTGDYYMVYNFPAYYEPTVKDISDDTSDFDDTNDSDVYLHESEEWRSPVISIDDGVSTHHDYDLGLIAKGDNTANITVSQTASGYKKIDNTVVNFGTKVPVNVGETTFFQVTVDNTGDLPIHNLTIEDQDISYTFASQAASITLDPNLTLINNRTIHIKKLDVGSSYTFTGEYLIAPSDDNGTAYSNFIRVYGNELTNKLTPTFIESSDYFDVASLTVDKKLTHIKKKLTTTKVAVLDPDSLGVSEGDTVYYDITVENTGSSTLNTIVTTDTLSLKKIGNPVRVDQNLIVSDIAVLGVGQSSTVSTSYTVLSDDEESLINTISILSDEVRTSETDQVTTTLKGLNVYNTVKEVNDLPPNLVNGNPVVKIGDIITFEYLIKNTDDVKTFNNLVVEDFMKGSGHPINGSPQVLDTDTIVVLGPGDSVAIEMDYTVVEADIDGFSTEALVNHVRVTADDGTVRNTLSQVELGHAAISIQTNYGAYTFADTDIVYTFKAMNYGTVDLDDLTLDVPYLGYNTIITDLVVDDTANIQDIYTTTDLNIENRFYDVVATISDDIASGSTTTKRLSYQPISRPTVTNRPLLDSSIAVKKVMVLEDGTIVFEANDGIELIRVTDDADRGKVAIFSGTTLNYFPDDIGKSDDFEIIVEHESVEKVVYIFIDEEDVPQSSIYVDAKYISGYADGTFRPNDFVTRAEIATMFAIIMMFDESEATEPIFKDIDDAHWAYSYVQTVASNGLFSGYVVDGERYFRPEDPITRAEIAQVISNYLTIVGRSVEVKEIEVSDMQMTHWAYDVVMQLYYLELVSGHMDGTFRPDDYLKREEAVLIINKLLNEQPLNKTASKFTDLNGSYRFLGEVEAASEITIK